MVSEEGKVIINPLFFSGLNPPRVAGWGHRFQGFLGLSVESLLRPKMCQQILSISRFLPRKGPNTSSVNSRTDSRFQGPAVRIYWNTQLLCSRSKPIPLHGRQCPTCAAELQPAHECDVMIHPAPVDLSQLRGEGNHTTARPGKGVSIPAPA